jgi:hypothetical protein
MPNTSGLKTSRKFLPPKEDVEGDDFTDDDDDNELCNLCCVCKQLQRVEMRNTVGIAFVKWRKCYFCPHWTHLGFSTDVSVLRTLSFY